MATVATAVKLTKGINCLLLVQLFPNCTRIYVISTSTLTHKISVNYNAKIMSIILETLNILAANIGI